MRKRLLSLLLTGAMAVGLLSGCGGGDGETQVATADNNTATASNATSASDTADGDSQQINLRAVSFGNNYDVQDMGWRWMMAECYEGPMKTVILLNMLEQSPWMSLMTDLCTPSI